MVLPSPDARYALLQARRNMKMARSAHAYVRGNTVQFYEWLHSQRGHAVPEGPAVWICGDCHIGNLGPLGDGDGKVELEIRDLDQTLIGNPAHDLVRLALSLAMAARGSNLPGVVTARMLEDMMRGYQEAFIAARGHGRIERPDAVRWVMRKAIARSWKQLARERLVNLRPSIPLGKNFWPLSCEENDGIAALFAAPEVQGLVTRLKSRSDGARVRVLDAAYWVKGCSSLGLLRYAVLVGVGDKGDGEYCLVDVKQAVKAAAPRYNHVSMPRDNAQRVVAGARHLSPALGERMVAQRFLERGVVLRELLPQDLKLEIEQMSMAEASAVAYYLAYVVGRAHARQMDEATRERWRIDLNLDRSKTLAAPTWLWESVVQLIAAHEAGYLHHCRKYALEQSAA
ncbi:uncharacterized protein (DUF2252 family) [Oxalobacteraceae bacterium GrIS 1.11]